MSFLYPRTIVISRSSIATNLGQSGYQGELVTKEDVVVDQVPASIQLMKGGAGRPNTALPGDASKKTFWKVLIPLAAVAQGTIQTHDIVTDDLGERYQVAGNYWNSLGYSLSCEKLDV